MAEGDGRGRSWIAGHKPALIGFTVAVAGLAVAYWETRTVERDRHALRDQLHALERSIRAHDTGIWGKLEAEHAATGAHPDEEAHRQLLADFDRLGHLDGFSIEPFKVEISGDSALVAYRVEGRSVRRGDPPAPSGGEVRFKKESNGAWRMTGHRLIERQ